MNTELLPCPHCGSNKVSGPHETSDDRTIRWWVECNACPAGMTIFKDDESAAIAAWNRRTLAAVEQAPGEPVAWRKTWFSSDLETRGCRVDLTPVCEPWLHAMNPTVEPLYLAQPAPQGQSSLRDEMVRFVTEHAGTKEAAATEFWLRKMPIALKTGEQQKENGDAR